VNRNVGRDSTMTAAARLRASETLPADGFSGALAGRVWRPDVEGPSVVAVRADAVFDISAEFPTMRDLCETADPAMSLKTARGEAIGSPIRRPTGAIFQGRGCSRPSIFRRSRRPA